MESNISNEHGLNDERGGQYGQPVGASLVIDEREVVSPIDDRMFGSFVEHLGRCVYTGIYEPGHPCADDHGFRRDVIDLVKELGVTTIRYPGGNFVSGYRWEDGVGPVSRRPRRLDLAWHSTETNAFGLHEMVDWLDAVGGNELMEAVNLGTRGLQEALNLLEYANIPSGTALSDLRRSNGADQPFDIRMWCLGNEMDGPWQTGHKTAEEYGALAASVARGMKSMDSGLELVVCGSSSHGMDTFGSWEATVLEHAYEVADFISCHAYYAPKSGDMASFMASGADMDAFINEVGAVVDSVKARKKTDHDVFISFDEWNVWYLEGEADKNPEGIDNWPVAPRLLEQCYTLADAVVFGDLLLTLLRHADRVRSASLAQLVNVIAPIMTEPGGAAWRQTIFYPFALTSGLAKGGKVLNVHPISESVKTERYGDVDMIDATAVRMIDGGLAIFAVNRSLESTVDLTVNVASRHYGSVVAKTLHDDDWYACNTCAQPNRVKLSCNETVALDGDAGTVRIALPPVSWTAIELRLIDGHENIIRSEGREVVSIADQLAI